MLYPIKFIYSINNKGMSKMNLYDIMMAPLEKRVLNGLRREIIPKASGDVLEIGAGTGANFSFYKQGQVSSFNILDIETSKIAKQRAPKNTVFTQSKSAQLPYEDESFDTVVESLVLCSIDDEQAMLSEIKRILKPDGILIHIDHGLPKNQKLKKLFRFFAPLWRRMTKSCRIDKDQRAIIIDSGLEIIEESTTAKGVFYWGIARKESQ